MIKRPMLQITFVEKKAAKTKVRGRMSRPPGLAKEGALLVPPDLLVNVRLMRYGRLLRLATFNVPDGEMATTLEVGGKYAYLSDCDLTSAEVVLSPSYTWRETVFHPRDGVMMQWNVFRVLRPLSDISDLSKLPPGATIVKNAWDHEHCIICNKCICEIHGPEAALSNDGVWVCKKCYDNHVLVKNIDFPEWT